MDSHDSLKKQKSQKKFTSLFILFSTFHISHKIIPFLRRGVGVCISLVGTEPIWENCASVVAKKLSFLVIYLVHFLSILSTKSTISQKLKIGKLFSPRCKDFFPYLSDLYERCGAFSHIRMCTLPPSPPLRNGGNFMKDAECELEIEWEK